MQAVILAAGMGKRLKELTNNNTKCMVKVNGVTMIDRMLHQIDHQKLKRIIIVVGYEGKKLIDYVNTLDIKTSIIFIDNPIYNKTNNIYSLSLAKDYLKEDDTILFESDLIFEERILESLLKDKRDTLVLVDKYEPWMDGTCVRLNKNDEIEDFIPGKKFDFNNAGDCYKTVNIYKFSKEFLINKYLPFLDAYQKALGLNEYYEQVLSVITMLDNPGIKGKRLNGEKWYEIDDIQDLNIAESMFASTIDERLDLLQSRFGGYWRYPNLIDFCYLVNPYYPSKKMIDEMKYSFERLLTEYPSGMKINALLVGKNFGVHSENILVGNGAAELIKSLMGFLKGKTGFIRPTFEEYPNRYDGDNSVYFNVDNDDYTYTKDDIINFFKDKDIKNLVLVNPDNPSGNYIPKEDLFILLDWAKKEKIKIILDESFVDFASFSDTSLIKQDILDKYPHLYVMKSISKSYGVPGLRLGVLASSDEKMIEKMKKDVSIWNINSFGEFYLQIFEKYNKDYLKALESFKEERSRFKKELDKIKNIHVIPSEANYFMIYLKDMSARKLTKILLDKYNLLIKDLTKKTAGKNYIRVAIRNTSDNDKLIMALKNELK